jgi:hypothetical protein
VAEFSRDDCGVVSSARLVYRASDPFVDYSEAVPLDFSAGSKAFYLIFPAYYLKEPNLSGISFADYTVQNQALYQEHFAGIELPAGSPACLRAVYRVKEPATLPFLINWRVPEQWRAAPLLQLPRLR